MSLNRVGVVILNFNSAEDTINCVGSVKASAYPHIDPIVVVDNGSSQSCLDKLRNELNTSGKTVLIELGANYGFSAGMNRGIEFAKKAGADSVLLLNNDTIMETDCIQHLVQTSQRSDAVGIVAPKIRDFEKPRVICFAGSRPGLQYPKQRGIGQVDRGQYDRLEKIEFASGCAFLMTDRAFNKVGLLDERFFFGGEDREISFRCTKAGLDIWYEPRAVIYHKNAATRKRIPQPERLYIGYLTQLFLIKKMKSRCIWLGWYGAYALYLLTIFPLRLALTSGIGMTYWESLCAAWSAWAFAYGAERAYPRKRIVVEPLRQMNDGKN